MLGKYSILVTMVYARDFPLNIKPTRNIATDNLMLNGGAKHDSRAESHAGATAEQPTVNRSTLMEESAARILASSRDANP